MRPKKETQKSAKSATVTGKAVKGFTDEERAAMKERAQELKAEARRGPRAKKADGEGDVLAKIAEMPEPDRAMAERRRRGKDRRGRGESGELGRSPAQGRPAPNTLQQTARDGEERCAAAGRSVCPTKGGRART